MRAEKRELGLGMIKAIDIGPRLGVVARFATERSAVGAFASHAIVKFALVRIFVAGGAGTIFELKRQNFVGASRNSYFVTIAAGHRHMRAAQRVAGSFVLGNGVGTAVPVRDRVAILTAIIVRSASKLVIVRVFMTIGAQREFHFVDSVFAGGNMALAAVHLDVRALQRILRRVVFLHAE